MIKIVAVSYLNTLPFLYGIQNSKFSKKVEIEKAVPSTCFEKVLNKQVDIALVPVAAIPKISGYKIITEYCIGADGAVDTVLLVSNKTINQIDQIFLDNESKTSIELIKILSKYFWNINPKFKNLSENIIGKESALIIGDKTFAYRNKYKYSIDLADQWKKFTSLPFVFACWVAKNTVEESIIEEFNLCLKKGVENIDEVITHYKNLIPNYVDADRYYSESIDFRLTKSKIEAMNLFFNYLNKMENL